MENKQDIHNELVTVPYFVHRDMIAHDRWVISRLVVALIITVILMVGTNLVWILEWNSYDFTSEEVITTLDSEGEGVNNYIGGDGGIAVGENNSAQTNENPD